MFPICLSVISEIKGHFMTCVLIAIINIYEFSSFHVYS